MMLWYIDKMIALCNYAGRFRDGAEDQSDINDVIAIKNYFISIRNKYI